MRPPDHLSASPSREEITVVIPTYNPDLSRLRATLAALKAQTLAVDRWTTIIVDNASSAFPAESAYADVAPSPFRLVHAPQPGLTSARARGLRESNTALVVLVDDDNVLAPDYLAGVLALFTANPRLGLAGGKSIARFEMAPPSWAAEFFPLLAVRDLGDRDLTSAPFDPGSPSRHYPPCAPIGAGMAGRVAAFTAWFDHVAAGGAICPDRRGSELSSGGDNDIVLWALRSGWEVGYFPRLQLTHLIPAGRLSVDYLARLNRGIQKSWMQVLSAHGANPWPPIARPSLPLRKLKMWFAHRAWRSPAGQIRWQGACGHFEGRCP